MRLSCEDSPTTLCDGAQMAIFSGNIIRSATRQYLSYSEADFEVFRPAGAKRCTDGVKFGMPNFTPIGATISV